MLEISDLTFTCDVEKEHEKELLCKILSNPGNIIDFTFSMGSLILIIPAPTQKQNFKEFDLGDIKGGLRRENLYEDR